MIKKATELDFSDKNIIMILSGLPGVGKEQPLSSLVLTPEGFKKMGEVIVGDCVIGADGRIYTVTGVFPQGIKPVYKVTFSDGASARCGLEHIWTVRAAFGNSRKLGWKNLTLQELIEKGISHDSPSRAKTNRKPLLRWEVPLVKPYQIQSQKLEIDPYLLGVLIGDGNMTGSIVQFSNPDMDSEVRLLVEELLPDEYTLSKHNGTSCPQYVIKQKLTGGKDGFLKKIKALGLDVPSPQKFIPSVYMTVSHEQKLLLLRGLMDTDGSAKSNRVSYSTTSMLLANNVVNLIQSLGGVAKLHTYDRTAENKPVEYDITVKINECPFNVARKAKEWKKSIITRHIESIDLDGQEECQCIMVSSPDGLYVTDNYIVTHNTTLALSAPDPVLIDVDEGISRVRPEHRKDTVLVSTYEELLKDTEALKGKYKTVIIDTTGALIELMKDWVMRTETDATQKNGAFSLRGYGYINREFKRLSAQLRRNFNVIFVFHSSKDRAGDEVTYEIVCEGSAKTLVWQPADLGAYLYMQGGDRWLGFSPTEQYSAKSAYGIKGLIKVPDLSDGSKNTFLETLFQRVRENIAKESIQYGADLDAYDKAMDAGLAIIREIKGPDDMQAAGAKIKMLKHALNSHAELGAAVKLHMEHIGWKWDKESKSYVAL